MSKIVSIHSFRGGTGKSNTTANLSYVLAAAGKRVCVIDTDIQSPGIHVLLGDPDYGGATLNDYLYGAAKIADVVVDVGSRHGLPAERLFLLPSSMDMGAITQVLKQGYDVGLLNDGFRELRVALDLDYLMIDTHPGLNEETLLSIAISDTLLLLMRPDQQDFQGTAVTAEIARRLKVPQTLLLVNKALTSLDEAALRRRAADVYGVAVAGILPLSEKMIELGSAGLFAREYPEERWSQVIRELAAQL